MFDPNRKGARSSFLLSGVPEKFGGLAIWKFFTIIKRGRLSTSDNKGEQHEIRKN